jgi:hypothetical protein
MNTNSKIIACILLLTMASCASKQNKNSQEQKKHSVLSFHSQQEADSLLVDLVTYIGRKPPLATSISRFDATFRPYYIQYAHEFNMLFYHVSSEGVHHYYLTRPARSVLGNRRGVGGMFRFDKEGISQFEELFNTPVSDEETLKQIGEELFAEMVEKGHVDAYAQKKEYIEWPDERLKYNKETNEWRYVEPQP